MVLMYTVPRMVLSYLGKKELLLFTFNDISPLMYAYHIIIELKEVRCIFRFSIKVKKIKLGYRISKASVFVVTR